MLKENVLKKIYCCNLYQVSEDIGVIEKKSIQSVDYSVDTMIQKLPGVKKVGTVLVKRSIIDRYRLRELITGIPIDTLYESTYAGSYFSGDWVKAKGRKEKYHTVIVVKSSSKDISIEQVNDYFDKHKDEEEYKNELNALIAKGEAALEQKIQEDNRTLETVAQKIKTR